MVSLISFLCKQWENFYFFQRGRAKIYKLKENFITGPLYAKNIFALWEYKYATGILKNTWYLSVKGERGQERRSVRVRMHEKDQSLALQRFKLPLFWKDGQVFTVWKETLNREWGLRNKSDYLIKLSHKKGYNSPLK